MHNDDNHDFNHGDDHMYHDNDEIFPTVGIFWQSCSGRVYLPFKLLTHSYNGIMGDRFQYSISEKLVKNVVDRIISHMG